jgi:lipopolysaccharide export system ATP-binding protein
MKLRTENLIKRYRSRTVVKEVSVDVSQGEIVGLLGPNGAGKTTTFYMIVGLITPNAGNIYLDDEIITREPVYKRAQKGIGYLAQEASVFRKLSVEDNIKAVLEMSNMSKAEQRDKVEQMLEEFGLRKIRKSLGIQLSGGGTTENRNCKEHWRLVQSLSCSMSHLPELTPLLLRIYNKLFRL